MKKITRFVFVIVVCMFLFVNCDYAGDERVSEETAVETVEQAAYFYKICKLQSRNFDLSESGAVWDYRDSIAVDGTIQIKLVTDSESYCLIFDEHGNEVQYQNITAASEHILSNGENTVLNYYCLADGSVIWETVNLTEQTVQLVKTDENGSVTAESERIPFDFTVSENSGSVFFMIPFIPVNDDHIIIYDNSDYTNFYIADGELVLHGPFPTASPLCDAYGTSDGMIVLCCDDGTVMCYDPNTDAVSSSALHTETDAYRRAEQIMYTDSGIYLIGDTGIHMQKQGTETFLFSWDASLVSKDSIDILAVLQNDCFLIGYRDALTGTYVPAILMPSDEVSTFTRPVVTVASYNCGSNESAVINAAITSYNQSNTAYMIEYTNYDTIQVDGTYTNDLAKHNARKKLLEEDLLTGVCYDVFILGSLNSRDYFCNLFEEQNLLCDLTEFCDGIGLTACVKASVENNDRITFLPLTYGMSTLLTTTDILPDGEGLTYAVLTEILSGLQEGQSLFGNDVSDELRAITQYDFVNKTEKSCSFDSDEYVDFLGFLDAMKISPKSPVATAYCNPYIGKITGSIGGQITFDCDFGLVTDTSNPVAALNDGTIKFLTCEIASVSNLYGLFYMLEQMEAEPNLCGYPSKAGGSIAYESGTLAAVMKNSKNQDGAISFLEMLLSDEVQTSEVLCDSGLPVTDSAFEKILQEGYYYFNESETVTTHHGGVNQGTYRIPVIAFRTYSEQPIPAHTYDYGISVSAEQAEWLQAYVRDSVMHGLADETIESIITEELSYVTAHIRTYEEASELIQSRVFIYLNE